MKSAFFFPSTVDVQELRASFKPLWGVKTGGEGSGHPATRIIPAACADPASNRYPFFVDYFSCGLCPPFSDFFCDVMRTFGFRLLDFTPNAVACTAFFAHLCEGFAGVQPNTMLFRHYFYPRIQGEAPSLVASPGSRGPRGHTQRVPRRIGGKNGGAGGAGSRRKTSRRSAKFAGCRRSAEAIGATSMLTTRSSRSPPPGSSGSPRLALPLR